MKKKILIVVLLLLLLVPVSSLASTKKKYSSLNLEQTLDQEEIEHAFENYKETSDAITIYLFRGYGCPYCQAFLKFLNSIVDEYGKYFKLVSYEVWNDQNNNNLMQIISNFLEKPATGVPYIIIGDQVFSGFSEAESPEPIKEAIKKLYDTKKSERYDVFEEYDKYLDEQNKPKTDPVTICWIVGSVAIGTIVVLMFVNMKYNSLLYEINKNKGSKEETEKKDNKKVVKKTKRP